MTRQEPWEPGTRGHVYITIFFKWIPCLIDAVPPDAASRLVLAKRGVEKLNAMFTMLDGSTSFLTREEIF